MRDIKVYSSDKYDLDINIVDGMPEFLSADSQTNDQRAGLAAFITIGTIPGRLTDGVDWGSLYSQDSSYVDISNQISKQVQNYVTGNTPSEVSYLPLIFPDDNSKLVVRMLRV